jgi:hypothetical protein
VRAEATAILVGLLVLAAGGGAPPPGATLESTRALLERLRATGRAEATIETTVEDPVAGSSRRMHGRLALELPHRARLDLDGGEILTLREDGGDWLQPGTAQLLRSGPRSVAPALRWSALLLASAPDSVHERALPGGGFELRAAGADSAVAAVQRVWLGAGGFPARLEVEDAGGERRTWLLRGWRFSHARGRDGFVLSAPRGITVVDLP